MAPSDTPARSAMASMRTPSSPAASNCSMVALIRAFTVACARACTVPTLALDHLPRSSLYFCSSIPGIYWLFSGPRDCLDFDYNTKQHEVIPISTISTTPEHTRPHRRIRLRAILATLSLVSAGLALAAVPLAQSTPAAAVDPCSAAAPTGGVIRTPGELLFLANSTDVGDMAGSYEQITDIDLADCPSITNWPGIGGGSDATAFTGTYDGGGYSISNVSMSATGDNDLVAFFDKTLGATLSGIHLQAVTVSSASFNFVDGAGLIDQAQDTVVSNVTISALNIGSGGQVDRAHRNSPLVCSGVPHL